MTRNMSGRSTTLALACSIAAHAAVLVVVGVVSRPAAAVEAASASDPWAGDTFDLDALLPPAAQTPASQAGLAGQAAAAVELPQPAERALAARPEPPATSDEPAAKPPEPSRKPPKRRVVERPREAAGRDASPATSSVASAEALAPPAPGDGPGAGSGTAGSSGAVGVGGVRNLAVAFTRAIPMAVSGDPVWGTLKLGDAGTFELRIEVDDAGKIVSAAPTRDGVAPHLQGLVQRTLPFLRAGRFALSHANVEAGVQTLQVSVSLSQVEGGVTDDDSSAGPYALGFEPPAEGRPGRAYFTLRSGRHVEVVVKVVGAG